MLVVMKQKHILIMFGEFSIIEKIFWMYNLLYMYAKGVLAE